MLERDNIVYSKGKKFALQIIGLYKGLIADKKIYVLANQILRSGTSIGANIAESRNAQSASDFISKLNIALKEADETLYWLDLLNESKEISPEQYETLEKDCREMIGLLVAIIKSKKRNEGVRIEN